MLNDSSLIHFNMRRASSAVWWVWDNNQSLMEHLMTKAVEVKCQVKLFIEMIRTHDFISFTYNIQLTKINLKL